MRREGKRMGGCHLHLLLKKILWEKPRHRIVFSSSDGEQHHFYRKWSLPSFMTLVHFMVSSLQCCQAAAINSDAVTLNRSTENKNCGMPLLNSKFNALLSKQQQYCSAIMLIRSYGNHNELIPNFNALESTKDCCKSYFSNMKLLILKGPMNGFLNVGTT